MVGKIGTGVLAAICGYAKRPRLLSDAPPVTSPVILAELVEIAELRIRLGRCETGSANQCLREELVGTVPVTLRIARGSADGELRILVDGFDPIAVMPPASIIIRPEGHGVVIERAGS